ncbi:GNAT family N-acetyltransferase [Nodularia spumigena CS-590/02]|uniref:GNAT family N-acetyltransferase n=1 Tax=Nodularia spumigena TaxID=70799 RepID=UPI00232AABF5|nr:GNAT family N-acetyltransferase [Nodularia spumigena]MDB9325544.1 GNAT family N-acetyltransferase [Nodularia spumigena CS-590/02]
MTNQKAQARKSTSINTETQDNQLQGRGFTVQKKSDTHIQKSDLNTLLLQAKSFGHSISKLAGQESSSALPQTNGLSIQPKLSIGEPGDRYEQEADRVASQVVQRIHAPSSTGESVQREAMPEEEDELQMKPLADSIQRMKGDEGAEDINYELQGGGGEYKAIQSSTKKTLGSIKYEIEIVGQEKICRLTSLETINDNDGGGSAKVPGLGTRLVNQLALDAKENTCSTISIGNAARTATDFYKKCGFYPDPQKIDKMAAEGYEDDVINKLANDNLLGNVDAVINMTTR